MNPGVEPSRYDSWMSVSEWSASSSCSVTDGDRDGGSADELGMSRGDGRLDARADSVLTELGDADVVSEGDEPEVRDTLGLLVPVDLCDGSGGLLVVDVDPGGDLLLGRLDRPGDNLLPSLVQRSVSLSELEQGHGNRRIHMSAVCLVLVVSEFVGVD